LLAITRKERGPGTGQKKKGVGLNPALTVTELQEGCFFT